MVVTGCRRELPFLVLAPRQSGGREGPAEAAHQSPTLHLAKNTRTAAMERSPTGRWLNGESLPSAWRMAHSALAGRRDRAANQRVGSGQLFTRP
jgi:hypothetical protein